MNLAELELEIRSVADMDIERAAAVGRAYADPGLCRSFAPRLFRRLGGELAGPIGKALLAEIEAAPLNHEESVLLATEIGPVELRWFIDDAETVDLYIFGAPEITRLVIAVHASWSEG